MRDPHWLGDDCCIDRAALIGFLRHDGNLFLFFCGSRPMITTDNFSSEELEKLTISGAPAAQT